MPIDLDSLIYAVPCGVPGDVNALSGRAHVCSDRMRIAVTECEPFEPVDCPYCLPDTAPRRYSIELVDVVFCEGCNYLNPDRAYKLTWMEGAPSNIPPLWFKWAGETCNWYVQWGLVRHQLFASGDCSSWPGTITDGPGSALLEVWGISEPMIRLTCSVPWMPYFRGTRSFPTTPDCREFVIPNELPPYCYGPDGWDGKFGHGGHAILRAM